MFFSISWETLLLLQFVLPHFISNTFDLLSFFTPLVLFKYNMDWALFQLLFVRKARKHLRQVTSIRANRKTMKIYTYDALKTPLHLTCVQAKHM